MTAKDILELRKTGHVEEAYTAARRLYATDKSPHASSAMFWTAADILKLRLEEGKLEEAHIILLAIERLLPTVPDKQGWVHETYEHVRLRWQQASTLQPTSKEMAEHAQLGKWGEEVASAYLQEKGYVILEHDWHSGHRDIDIIARQDDVIVFVEVKTRRNTVFGQPEQAVDYKKQQNLRHAINHYVKCRRLCASIRFDIITVVGTLGCPHPAINHIEDVDIIR